jgi:hypothetical protein
MMAEPNRSAGTDAEALPSFLRDAPLDDEPLTAEELAAIEEGRQAIVRGETISHEDLRRALGL